MDIATHRRHKSVSLIFSDAPFPVSKGAILILLVIVDVLHLFHKIIQLTVYLQYRKTQQQIRAKE